MTDTLFFRRLGGDGLVIAVPALYRRTRADVDELGAARGHATSRPVLTKFLAADFEGCVLLGGRRHRGHLSGHVSGHVADS